MAQHSQVFKGQVKYSSIQKGSIPYKSGHLALSQDDRGWKMDLVLTVTQNGRPALTIRISKESVKKVTTNATTVYIDLNVDRSSLCIYFKALWPNENKQLSDLINRILTASAKESVIRSEVCIIEDDPPNQFTSVKEIKHVKYDEECKENIGFPNKSEVFLQRSMEKASSRVNSSTKRFYGKQSSYGPRPLSSSTPSKQNQPSIKRVPGLMPDPTPIKKPRLSGLAPNYSMKTKLFHQDDHKTQEKTQAQQQALQGFSNLGNTCYMNAILQSLFGLDTFATDLICNRRMLRYLSNQSLYNAMCKLLHTKRQQVSSDVSKRESLRRVKSAISNSAKRFSGYGQHDAHEFLGQVLDQLKEEIVKITKSTPSPNREGEVKFDRLPSPASLCANPVADNFEFEILHSISCEKCGHQLTKTEQFNDISVDVPKRKDMMTPRSLQDALGLFFRNEKFEYKCENCGHDKSDVSHKISRLPRVFILHLKRYTYNQMFKNTKMGQSVTIPLYLTLKNHCTDETMPALPLTSFNTSSSYSDQKSLLDFSNEDDVPSRRKLDYKSQFQDKSSQKNDHSYFSETKEKKEEDPDLTRAIEMSLQDMESTDMKEDVDDDMARAIEMSLKEQEERERETMKTTFTDDNSDAELEKAIELSRQGHDFESWTLPAEDKENKDPTGEQPQLTDPKDIFGEISDNSTDEVDGRVEEIIDLTEIKNEKGELPYSYRLVSIVNHMGISSITGHYLSDVYDMKKRCWYSYDDSHVVTIPESEVTSKRERSGYIFFYLNKDTFDDLALNNSLLSTSCSTT